jgi:hypothetical protein
MENKKLSEIDKNLNDIELELTEILGINLNSDISDIDESKIKNIDLDRLTEIFDKIDNQIANMEFDDDTIN